MSLYFMDSYVIIYHGWLCHYISWMVMSLYIMDSYVIIYHGWLCICYVMPRVLYQVYNHRAQGLQARGRGDYKPDIARVCMT